MYSAVICALVDGINSINLYKYSEGNIFVRNDDSFDVLGFVQNQNFKSNCRVNFCYFIFRFRLKKLTSWLNWIQIWMEIQSNWIPNDLPLPSPTCNSMVYQYNHLQTPLPILWSCPLLMEVWAKAYLICQCIWLVQQIQEYKQKWQ